MEQECIKCAKCNPICPTFISSGNEAYSPRGYLHLCSLPPFPNTLTILSACTLCRECEKLCPLNLPIAKMIEEKRKNIETSNSFKAPK